MLIYYNISKDINRKIFDIFLLLSNRKLIEFIFYYYYLITNYPYFIYSTHLIYILVNFLIETERDFI